MDVTISADHRITDGAGAAEMLAEVKRLLENPVVLIAAQGLSAFADTWS